MKISGNLETGETRRYKTIRYKIQDMFVQVLRRIQKKGQVLKISEIGPENCLSL